MVDMAHLLAAFLSSLAIIVQFTTCSNCSELRCRRSWFVPSAENGSPQASEPDCVRGRNIKDVLEYDELKKYFLLISSSCMTLDEKDNITYVGSCPSNSLEITLENNLETVVPHNVSDLNDAMCSAYNRTGLLCSRCGGDLGPAVLSIFSKCLECHEYGWAFFILLTFVPTTLFSLVIIIFRINVFSPSLKMLVICCQIITNLFFFVPLKYSLSLGGTWLKIIISIYGIWNLDFFRYVLPFFCISKKMDMLQVVALEYIVAFYPILLMALVYYMIEWHDRGCVVLVYAWRPFHKCFSRFRRTWQLKGSVLNAFITFLTLSSAKLLTISMTLIRLIEVRDSCGNYLGTKVYLDPSLKAFSPKHLNHAIPAIIIIIFFNVLPTVYITLYPIRRCKRILDKLVPYVLCQELARMTQIGFKDGTNGTRDYRSFAGLYASSRFLFLAILFGKDASIFLSLTLLTFGILIIGFQPYNKMIYNVIDFFILLSISISMFIFYLARISDAVQNVYFLVKYFMNFPLVYMLAYISWIITKKAYFLIKKRYGYRRSLDESLDTTLTTTVDVMYASQDTIF